ncbi:type II secretion system protein [Metabacillus idriensis]|uniref:type II secretion system protein n=1 Tax=Metabacillus idriensis TaxID=324768 RepID=UPI00174E82A1|nr:hypothetical protein [Metabacillus idriensis]
MRPTNDNVFKNREFTLLEVIVIFTILGILTGIAVLLVIGLKEKAEQDVCYVNRIEVERMYETYLSVENIYHTEGVSVQYLNEFGEKVCPVDGVGSYVGGKIECSVILVMVVVIIMMRKVRVFLFCYWILKKWVNFVFGRVRGIVSRFIIGFPFYNAVYGVCSE